MRETLRKNNGITLIALVITIIVLLILAGVVVATLTGDNGLLTRTTQTKQATAVGAAKDAASIEIINAKVEALENQYKDETDGKTTIQLMGDALQANNSAEKIEAVNDKITATVTPADDKITIEIKYDGKLATTGTVTGEGTVTWVDSTGTTSDDNDNPGDDPVVEPTAYSDEVKEALAINNNVSKYVEYNGITCRVLYDASSPYGIEIISANVMKTGNTVNTVPLGTNDTKVTNDDFDITRITGGTSNTNARKAAASYNRSVTTLNEVAESYRNKTDGIADRARCVGSNPSKPNDITVTAYEVEDDATNAYIKTYGYNKKFKVADDNYTIDSTQMRSLGIRDIWQSYWLASRYIFGNEDNTSFYTRYIYLNNGPYTGTGEFYVAKERIHSRQ